MGFRVGGGLDVASLVSQLMAVERAPAQRWNALRLTALSQQTAWADLGSKLSAVRTAAEALDTAREVATSSATSSDPTVLTATAANGAAVGATSMYVKRLAVAQQDVSGGLSGPSQAIGAGRAVVTTGTGPTGLGAPTISSALTAGRHTVTVHAAQPAVVTSTPPLLDVASGGLTITLSVGGGPATTYRLEPPATAFTSVTELARALGATLEGVARVGVVNGTLQVSSLSTGSDAALTFGSGSGETALGLSGATARGTGVQASLDGGTRQDVAAGAPVTLSNSAGGSVSFTPTGTPVPGTVTMNVVDTAAGATLADLTAALNAAGSPVSAALVDSGSTDRTNPYHLVLSANGAGNAGAYTIDAAGHAGLAALLASPDAKTTAAADAEIYVGGSYDPATGTGTGGLLVTRSSNTITDLLPDVTLALVKPGAATVGVSRDPAALASKAKGLVEAVNALLTAVATQTKPGSEGAKGGPLSGSYAARAISAQMFSAGAAAVPSGTMRALSQLGIEVTRDGRYKLDEAALGRAVATDAAGAAGLLSSFAASLATYAKEAGRLDGPISSAGKAAGNAARTRQQQIDALDKRLVTIERRYTAQYAKLNATMSVLSGQSSQLAGQIANMYV